MTIGSVTCRWTESSVHIRLLINIALFSAASTEKRLQTRKLKTARLKSSNWLWMALTLSKGCKWLRYRTTQVATSANQHAHLFWMSVELAGTIQAILSLCRQFFLTEKLYLSSRASILLDHCMTNCSLRMKKFKAQSRGAASTKDAARWSCSMRLGWASSL